MSGKNVAPIMLPDMAMRCQETAGIAAGVRIDGAYRNPPGRPRRRYLQKPAGFALNAGGRRTPRPDYTAKTAIAIKMTDRYINEKKNDFLAQRNVPSGSRHMRARQ